MELEALRAYAAELEQRLAASESSEELECLRQYSSQLEQRLTSLEHTGCEPINAQDSKETSLELEASRAYAAELEQRLAATGSPEELESLRQFSSQLEQRLTSIEHKAPETMVAQDSENIGLELEASRAYASELEQQLAATKHFVKLDEEIQNAPPLHQRPATIEQSTFDVHVSPQELEDVRRYATQLEQRVAISQWGLGN